MNYRIMLLLIVLAVPVLAEDLMEDCKPGGKKGGMQCVSRNGLCLDISIDGYQTQPIEKADRKRLMKLPDMDGVCWQINSAVSAQFRIKAQMGGLHPSFIGTIKSLKALVVPIDDYDPEYDSSNYINPLYGFNLEADGYRNGTWQLQEETCCKTSKSDKLTAGEYIIILRVYGKDNWDRQEILLTIDPDLSPIPAQHGTK